jgi:hypothetical protein
VRSWRAHGGAIRRYGTSFVVTADVCRSVQFMQKTIADQRRTFVITSADDGDVCLW